jgi:hypothetical protein
MPLFCLHVRGTLPFIFESHRVSPLLTIVTLTSRPLQLDTDAAPVQSDFSKYSLISRDRLFGKKIAVFI